jgi:hypothetical protein
MKGSQEPKAHEQVAPSEGVVRVYFKIYAPRWDYWRDERSYYSIHEAFLHPRLPK